MRQTLVFALLALISVTVVLGSSARPALAANASGIDAGGRHTCALFDLPEPAEDFSVKCWGDNLEGQLGDGTNVDRASPVSTCVDGMTPPCASLATVLTGVVAVSAGGVVTEREGGHTCALTTAGGVKCWGDNSSGQLGDGTNINRTTPVDVVGLTSGVAAIAAGGFHTCAITTAGGAKCWGLNDGGQLGDGTNINSNLPVDVCADAACAASLSGASVPTDISPPALDAGDKHTCALTDAGGLICWGDNSSGQLGDGNACGAACSAPTEVSGLASGVITVAAGGSHACARVDGDQLKCWGANDNGQLAAFSPAAIQSVPVRVCVDTDCTSLGDFLTGVSRVTAGDDHTCVRTTTDRVLCWGLNDQGQIGNGTNTSHSRPQDVCDDDACAGVLSGVEAIAAGGAHTCALTSANVVHCWGWNRFGQIGSTTTDDVNAPFEIEGAKAPVAPTAPGDANCSGDVTSIDALLILQLNAGLIGDVSCPENVDINGDGRADSLDAVLILQFVAGFFGTLPP